MSKRKAKWGLECGAEIGDCNSEGYLAEVTHTPQTTSMQVDTTAEEGPKETPVTPVTATVSHVDELGASPFWCYLGMSGTQPGRLYWWRPCNRVWEGWSSTDIGWLRLGRTL